MNKCKCGKSITIWDKYCDECENNLSLRDKVFEEIRKDKMFNN